MNPISPEEYLAEFARRSGLDQTQIRRFLQTQAEMAYLHGLRGFPVPGLGVIEVVVIPEKVIEHKFGPRKGQAVRMPERKKLSFRFTPTGASGLFGTQAAIPDVFEVNWYPDPEEDLDSPQPPVAT